MGTQSRIRAQFVHLYTLYIRKQFSSRWQLKFSLGYDIFPAVKKQCYSRCQYIFLVLPRSKTYILIYWEVKEEARPGFVLFDQAGRHALFPQTPDNSPVRLISSISGYQKIQRVLDVG